MLAILLSDPTALRWLDGVEETKLCSETETMREMMKDG